jgi:DNA-3-methyladenine glycosylase II
VDGDYERQVGVEARQSGQTLALELHGTPGSRPFDEETTETIARQVARVLSVDHDGIAFAEVCASDPVLARLHAIAPGFRPANFYSPYEAAVWSIISARRVRSQGIALRTRMGQQFGAVFELAGQQATAVPTPSRLLELEAQAGHLSAARLLAMDPTEARAELQRLPGIGPFYSALILIRACGATDLLSTDEAKSREAMRDLYGWDHLPSDAELEVLAEGWRPFRTWVAVLIRATSGRLSP